MRVHHQPLPRWVLSQREVLYRLAFWLTLDSGSAVRLVQDTVRDVMARVKHPSGVAEARIAFFRTICRLAVHRPDPDHGVQACQPTSACPALARCASEGVSDVFRRLSIELRTALLLQMLAGLSRAEIAMVLEIDACTLDARLAQSRQLLLDDVSAEGISEDSAAQAGQAGEYGSRISRHDIKGATAQPDTVDTLQRLSC